MLRYPVNTKNAREGEENLRRRMLTEPWTPERMLSLWDESGVRGTLCVDDNCTGSFWLGGGGAIATLAR